MSHAKKYDLVMVIPCYNETKSLKAEKFLQFLKKHKNTAICFVNDGSTDGTLLVLQEIQQQNTTQIFVYDCKENGGKAEATRLGMLFVSEQVSFQYAAFLDADLATSLKECYRLHRKIVGKKLTFVFGSRVKILGATIERSYFRFFTGRIIATFISNILDLGVYDTQCGVKIFKHTIVKQIFKDRFISKWLFDVEIFFRIIAIYGRKEAKAKMKEIPLHKWVDKGDSKVKLSYFFKLWFDLFKIQRAYKHL